MANLYAQGDLLFEEIRAVPVSGETIPRHPDGVYVLADGELTGHRHTMEENVAFFRDDGLARDMPHDLYIGHVRVDGPVAFVTHQEHAPVALPTGTYRVRRQRELQPKDVRLVTD
jgi:hypothetical protein